MISTVTATTTTTQFVTYGIIAVIALIAFLAFKEVLSSEAHKNRRIRSFVEGSNIAIVPLLSVFVAIVAYKVVTIL